MKINILLAVLLGLLAVSCGFQLRGKYRRGDEDGNGGDKDRDGGNGGGNDTPPIPSRFVVQVIAKRIDKQLAECIAPELDEKVSSTVTLEDVYRGLSMLLLANCGHENES
ncbi:uncharacterized protein LOC130048326 [Ostrea edulis]|uniref:uncharacterized protein LOC130048326 n=1 Tax=Ostrea edulis TaxID=37623 RepID=UPI0024AFA525|nr:uncharacterized protein LOC130048326 [Ostrea edulis]